MRDKLTGKVAVITGVSSEIGDSVNHVEQFQDAQARALRS